MSEIFSEPDDFGPPRASEATTTLGGSLAAQAADALDPQDSPSAAWLFRRAREALAGGMTEAVGAAGDLDVYSVQSLEERQAAIDASRDAIPDTSIEDARKRVTEEGLDGKVHLPDQPSIKSPVLDLMLQEAHDRRDREAAIERGPHGFFPGALGMVTSLGVGMIDPVNAAAFSIPVLGEAKLGKIIASAGDSILARGAVKAGIGAAQGAVGTAALQPADWWLHTQDGQDYTFAQALESVVMGAGMGAVAHSATGLYGDVRSRLRGAPLEGSPQDLLLRGLMTGTHVHADQLADEGVPIGEVPGISDGLANPVLADQSMPAPAATEPSPPFPGDVPLHPAEILADLPPAAREDAVHAAMADVIAGRPTQGAEMLQIAADHDPRIAESFEAFHGSPHDFDRFDIGKIGDGEGAQSFGHGLYFAENETIAAGYREKLTEKFNRRPVTVDLPGNPFSGSEILEQDPTRPGALYKVRITADRSKLLDWDKDVGDQPHLLKMLDDHPELKQALEDALDDHMMSTDLDVYTGRELYHMLRHHASEGALPGDEGIGGDDNKEVGEFLKRAGLHGVQYLDAGSRKAGEGTRNYVVFDDKHIEITHKNGEAVGLDQFKNSPEARAEQAAQPAIPDLTTTHVTAPKPRGRAAAHPDTLSLNEHLASHGGLRPDPELEAIYGTKRGPFVPGLGPLIRKRGMRLDEALSSAKQHGYMSDPHDVANGTAGTRGRTDLGLIVPDLLDRLDAENRGQKLYKPNHVEATKYDPEQEKHVIMGALEQQLHESGLPVSDIDPALLNRAVEIVHREGVLDVMDAYFRAIMEDEERYNAIADARRSDPELANVPGWDDVHDAGTEPGNGSADPLDDRQAGRPGQEAGRADGAQPGGPRGSSLAAAASDPRWRALADTTSDYDEPEVLEESRAADHEPEPASTEVPEKSLTALEKAAADAEAIWRRIEPTLTEKERALVNNVLDQLKLDKDTRDKIINDTVACLVGAVG
jgi:hypothetical protein